MIKFTLVCDQGHDFESWFQNSGAFDLQSEAGLVACPTCRSTRVTKAIMAPAIVSRRSREAVSAAATPAPAAAEPSTKVALIDEKDRELRAMITAIRQRIFAEADDVGARFPEEARKIHNGLVEERPIHGQASLEEARDLIEEGIGVLPIPSLPDEHN